MTQMTSTPTTDLTTELESYRRELTAYTGRCDLAAHRDYLDREHGAFVCGYNPHQAADDTVLTARVTSDEGELLATIVNYACHPTTLAWDNTLISPDYVGAMREVVEQATAAPCLIGPACELDRFAKALVMETGRPAAIMRSFQK